MNTKREVMAEFERLSEAHEKAFRAYREGFAALQAADLYPEVRRTMEAMNAFSREWAPKIEALPP